MSLGVEEVDEYNFDGNPATVDREVLPSDSFQSNGVYICRKESRTTPEELLDGDATGSFGKWEKFNEISVGQGVVANVVRCGRQSGIKKLPF